MNCFYEIKLGIFNAWIGTFALYFIGMFIALADKKAAKRLFDMSWYNSEERVWAIWSMIFMYGLMIFSIWTPLKLGSGWFYTGAVVWLSGVAGYFTALYNYAATPQNEMVSGGMYKYSRNPLYFFYSLATLGVCIASASLPLFTVWIIYNILVHMLILGEERYCLETYGAEYGEFKKRTPRYFLFF